MSTITTKVVRRPFEPQYDDKRNFRAWVLEQFPRLTPYSMNFLEKYPEFEERLQEIHDGVMLVLNRIMRTYPELRDLMHQYYASDFRNLPKAFEGKNVREYAKRLDDFLCGIEME